jgi:hypothetical protein
MITGNGDTATNRHYGRSGNKESAGFVHIALFSRLLYSDEIALKPPPQIERASLWQLHKSN